jgi:hypothetical protein
MSAPEFSLLSRLLNPLLRTPKIHRILGRYLGLGLCPYWGISSPDFGSIRPKLIGGNSASRKTNDFRCGLKFRRPDCSVTSNLANECDSD